MMCAEAQRPNQRPPHSVLHRRLDHRISYGPVGRSGTEDEIGHDCVERRARGRYFGERGRDQ
jgi:hypothetical protein